MHPGAIISFHTVDGVQEGQVLNVGSDKIEVKKLYCPQILFIFEWQAALRERRIGITTGYIFIDLCKTLVIPGSLYYKRPSVLRRLHAWCQCGKFKPVQPCGWRLKYLIAGTLCIDGWFVPFPYQAIREVVFLPQYNFLTNGQSEIEL